MYHSQTNMDQGNPKRYFQSWPGLTIQIVRKCLPNCVVAAKGQIVQVRKHMQQTNTIDV